MSDKSSATAGLLTRLDAVAVVDAVSADCDGCELAFPLPSMIVP